MKILWETRYRWKYFLTFKESRGVERRKTVRYHGECIIHLLNLGEGCEVFLEGFPSDEGRLKIVSPWPLAHFTEKKTPFLFPFIRETLNRTNYQSFFFFKLFFSINFIFHKLEKRIFSYRLDRFNYREWYRILFAEQ